MDNQDLDSTTPHLKQASPIGSSWWPTIVFVALSLAMLYFILLPRLFLDSWGPLTSLEQWGQFGDYFGGLAGTLGSFVAIFLLLTSYHQTSRGLRDSAASAVAAQESAARAATALVDLSRHARVAAQRDELLRVLQLMQGHVDELLGAPNSAFLPGGVVRGTPSKITLHELSNQRMQLDEHSTSTLVLRILQERPGIILDAVTSIEHMLDLVDVHEAPTAPEGLLRAYLRLKNQRFVQLLRYNLPEGEDEITSLPEARILKLLDRLIIDEMRSP